MWFSHLSFSIPERSLLTAGVKAIGLKFLGQRGSSVAALFPISLKTATFQLDGMPPSVRMVLKRSSSAGTRDGHFLNTWYGSWSKGDGAEADLDLLMAANSSFCVTGMRDGMACCGLGGGGTHTGVE